MSTGSVSHKTAMNHSSLETTLSTLCICTRASAASRVGPQVQRPQQCARGLYVASQASNLQRTEVTKGHRELDKVMTVCPAGQGSEAVLRPLKGVQCHSREVRRIHAP